MPTDPPAPEATPQGNPSLRLPADTDFAANHSASARVIQASPTAHIQAVAEQVQADLQRLTLAVNHLAVPSLINRAQKPLNLEQGDIAFVTGDHSVYKAYRSSTATVDYHRIDPEPRRIDSMGKLGEPSSDIVYIQPGDETKVKAWLAYNQTDGKKAVFIRSAKHNNELGVFLLDPMKAQKLPENPVAYFVVETKPRKDFSPLELMNTDDSTKVHLGDPIIEVIKVA